MPASSEILASLERIANEAEASVVAVMWHVVVTAVPLGVLPCPTLALVSGAALWAGGLVGGTWRITLAGVAAFTLAAERDDLTLPRPLHPRGDQAYAPRAST